MNLDIALPLPSNISSLLSTEKNSIVTDNIFLGKLLSVYNENEEHFQESSLIMQEERTIYNLKSLFVFEESENEMKIESFIKKRRLYNILIEAYEEIYNIFGPKIAEIRLELYKDFEEDWEELFIKVEIKTTSLDEMKRNLELEKELIKKLLFTKGKIIEEKLNLIVESI